MRNRAIASAITGETCTVPFELNHPDVPKTNDILFFTGASHWTRRWPLRNWHKLEKLLPAESTPVYAQQNSPLPKFFDQVASAAVVVTNDTMASHAAAAIGVPCVTITNGISGKGGFWPYPEEVGKPCRAIEARVRRLPRFIPAFARERLNQYVALAAIAPEEVSVAIKRALHDEG